MTEDAQRQVAKAIVAKLERVGRATEAQLRKAQHSKLRGDFPAVFDLFIDKRFLTPIEGDGPVQYELAEGGADL